KQARRLKKLLLPMLRFLLNRPNSWLLLQNKDDQALLQKHGLTPKGRTGVIRGSGIDLARYAEKPLPSPQGDFICAYAGRMIGIKGLETLKEALELLATRKPPIQLWLCGAPDPGNPGSWTEE